MILPRHVAIVMDGNGRWASARGLPRIAGHKVGADVVRNITKICAEKKIEVLTLFAFSTENWQRSPEEVGFLMEQLFVRSLDNEVANLHKNNIQFRVIGDTERLSDKLQQKILDAKKLTANNTGLKLVLALSYSGRWDIVAAGRKLGEEIALGKLRAQDITIEKFHENICLYDLPEPDLLIRTSGEQRISNFMLWQLAYTELYFTDVLWPDFGQEDFEKALTIYSQRNRRFGTC